MGFPHQGVLIHVLKANFYDIHEQNWEILLVIQVINNSDQDVAQHYNQYHSQKDPEMLNQKRLHFLTTLPEVQGLQSKVMYHGSLMSEFVQISPLEQG